MDTRLNRAITNLTLSVIAVCLLGAGKPNAADSSGCAEACVKDSWLYRHPTSAEQETTYEDLM
jgi:hypothetical protein